MVRSRDLTILENEIKEIKNFKTKFEKITLTENKIEIKENSNLEIEVKNNFNLELFFSEDKQIYSKIKINIKKNVKFNLLLNFKNPNNVSEIELNLNENSTVKLGEKILESKYIKITSNLSKNSKIDVKSSYGIQDLKIGIFHIMNHKDEKSNSNFNVSGVARGKSYIINDGLVNIENKASNSIGHQILKNIILSSDSKIFSEPQLEVNNNAVECSHGSSISKFKDSDLFYLTSRGICNDDAKELLIEGFFNQVDEFIR